MSESKNANQLKQRQARRNTSGDELRPEQKGVSIITDARVFISGQNCKGSIKGSTYAGVDIVSMDKTIQRQGFRWSSI